MRTATILVAGAIGLCGCTSQAPAPASRRGGGGPAAVAVEEVRRVDLARLVTLTAPVEPIRVVGVNSRATGTILRVDVLEGTRVVPGQLLAELDTRETAAQLARARAVLANAKAAFDRSEQMHSARIITDAEFEQNRAAFGTAASDVDLWETRLEFGKVLAPTAGVVTAKQVEAGSAVTANQRLFDIADDAMLVVRVQMSELDVVRLQAGDPVSVQLDALPGRMVEGRVRRIFPSADATTRLVPVEVSLARTSGSSEMRPGFLARATFNLDRRPNALVVPAAAVGASATGPFVFAVVADTLVRKRISIGLTSEGQVEVLGGLTEGDLVVTSGQLNLRDGAPVRVTRRGGEATDQGPVAEAAVRDSGSRGTGR